MALLLRYCKLDLALFARNYGSQRHQQNYYEVLGVPSDCTQKEIRQAFLRLSKQMHPDVRGKEGHTDFVKLNEAYSVLSKQHTRQQYDVDIRYNRMNSTMGNRMYYHPANPNVMYNSYEEWEAHMAGGPWPRPENSYSSHKYRNFVFNVVVTLVIISMVLQLVVVQNAMHMRRRRLLDLTKQYEHELSNSRHGKERKDQELEDLIQKINVYNRK